MVWAGKTEEAAGICDPDGLGADASVQAVLTTEGLRGVGPGDAWW